MLLRRIQEEQAAENLRKAEEVKRTKPIVVKTDKGDKKLKPNQI